MVSRVIEGLKWAKRLESRPSNIPVGRPRGAKLEGLRYERGLAKALGTKAEHGVWFEYEDKRGKRPCQPDFLCKLGKKLVILETKYSWVLDGHRQLECLYRPVVEAALGLPTMGVVVCKRLTTGIPSWVKVRLSLEEALEEAEQRRTAVWHYLGGVPQLRKFTPKGLDFCPKGAKYGGRETGQWQN